MAIIRISLFNRSTTLTDAEVAQAVLALQTQIHRDFAPAWGIDADLVFVPKNAAPAPRSWWVTILDHSDQAGALGYHDVTSEGLPLGKVFAATDRQYGNQWTVTASHEILKMPADPAINIQVFVHDSHTYGRTNFYEQADSCYAEGGGYSLHSG